MYGGPAGYTTRQGYDYVTQDQGPGALEIFGPLVAWGGTHVAHRFLTKSRFTDTHPKFLRGAQRAEEGNWYHQWHGQGKGTKASRQRVDAFIGQYYRKHYTADVAKFNRGRPETKLAQTMSKAQFSSAAKRAMTRSVAGKFTGRLLGVMNFMFIAPMLYGLTYHGYKGIQKLGYELDSPAFGRNFAMPTAAFTDRQRAIQRMHDSEYSGRQFLGNEAVVYHR